MTFNNMPLPRKDYQPLKRPEPLIKVRSLVAVIFERNDLDLAEQFLVDFGLVVAKREVNTLYLRGTDPAPYCYIVKKGPSNRFVGSVYCVDKRADLERLSSVMDTPIKPTGRPGGGESVSLFDPNGFQVDVEYGVDLVDAIETRNEPFMPNGPKKKIRINAGVRPPLQASPVSRIGHWVMRAPTFSVTVQWYMRLLGLIPTDVQCTEDGAPVLAFLRCDLGNEPAEHHTTVIAFFPETTFAHCAFETVDIDVIGQGQQYMRSKNWQHHWGIGRHVLGSQIFDYWKDPWGAEHEHYADSDVFTADRETEYYDSGAKGLWSWGHDLPPRKVDHAASADLSDLTDEQKKLLEQLNKTQPAPPRPWLKSK
jgi:hypothetical protein